MIRCYCDECQKLDRKRYQGIPGTFQMRLCSDQAQSPAPPAPIEPPEHIARLLAPSADDLPLFVGSLEPSLF